MIFISWFFYWGSLFIVATSISFISYWSGYRRGNFDGTGKGYAKGYAMGRKVEQIAARND